MSDDILQQKTDGIARFDKVAELPDDAELRDILKCDDDTLLLAMDDEGNLFNLGNDVTLYEWEPEGDE